MLEPKLFLVDCCRQSILLRSGGMVAEIVGDEAEAVAGCRQIRPPSPVLPFERGDLLLEGLSSTGPILETGPGCSDLAERRGGVDRLRAWVARAVGCQHRASPFEAAERVAPAVNRHETVAEHRQRVPVTGRCDKWTGGEKRASKGGECIDRLLGPAESVAGLPFEDEEGEDFAVVVPLRCEQRRQGLVDDAEGLRKLLAPQRPHGGLSGRVPGADRGWRRDGGLLACCHGGDKPCGDKPCEG